MQNIFSYCLLFFLVYPLIAGGSPQNSDSGPAASGAPISILQKFNDDAKDILMFDNDGRISYELLSSNLPFVMTAIGTAKKTLNQNYDEIDKLLQKKNWDEVQIFFEQEAELKIAMKELANESLTTLSDKVLNFIHSRLLNKEHKSLDYIIKSLNQNKLSSIINGFINYSDETKIQVKRVSLAWFFTKNIYRSANGSSKEISMMMSHLNLLLDTIEAFPSTPLLFNGLLEIPSTTIPLANYMYTLSYQCSNRLKFLCVGAAETIRVPDDIKKELETKYRELQNRTINEISFTYPRNDKVGNTTYILKNIHFADDIITAEECFVDGEKMVSFQLKRDLLLHGNPFSFPEHWNKKQTNLFTSLIIPFDKVSFPTPEISFNPPAALFEEQSTYIKLLQHVLNFHKLKVKYPREKAYIHAYMGTKTIIPRNLILSSPDDHHELMSATEPLRLSTNFFKEKDNAYICKNEPVHQLIIYAIGYTNKLTIEDLKVDALDDEDLKKLCNKNGLSIDNYVFDKDTALKNLEMIFNRYKTITNAQYDLLSDKEEDGSTMFYLVRPEQLYPHYLLQYSPDALAAIQKLNPNNQ